MIYVELKQAGQIDLSEYRQKEEFSRLCQFAESLDVGISDEYTYHSRDGTVGLDCLVRQADWANIKQKGHVATASLEFVLSYLNAGYIPFAVFNNAAITLARKYRAKYGVNVDEKTAMAAVLMVAVGYEQMKLCFLRKMTENHNRKVKQCDDDNAPVRGVTPAYLYAKYHIDLLEMARGKIVQAYQMERVHEYFEILQYRKEGDNLTPLRREVLDKNRNQLNRFLDDNPGKGISILTYHEQPNGNVRVLLYGPYIKVDPVRSGQATQK